MYQFTKYENPSWEGRRNGPGAKVAERIAFETCPVGQAFFIPSGIAPKGSVRAWANLIGKERGVKFSVRASSEGLNVYCMPRPEQTA